MAGVVGFENTVQGIKTRGYRHQASHNPLKYFLSFSCFLCVTRKITKTVVKSVVKIWINWAK